MKHFSATVQRAPVGTAQHHNEDSARINAFITIKKNKSSPVTSLEWPRGFQEVKVPRFRDKGTGRW